MITVMKIQLDMDNGRYWLVLWNDNRFYQKSVSKKEAFTIARSLGIKVNNIEKFIQNELPYEGENQM